MIDLWFPIEANGFQALDGICAQQVATPELALQLHPQSQLACLQTPSPSPVKPQPAEFSLPD
jgi:hypothetical protein